jgi:hypothetical protein
MKSTASGDRITDKLIHFKIPGRKWAWNNDGVMPDFAWSA